MYLILFLLNRVFYPLNLGNRMVYFSGGKKIRGPFNFKRLKIWQNTSSTVKSCIKIIFFKTNNIFQLLPNHAVYACIFLTGGGKYTYTHTQTYIF